MAAVNWRSKSLVSSAWGPRKHVCPHPPSTSFLGTVTDTTQLLRKWYNLAL